MVAKVAPSAIVVCVVSESTGASVEATIAGEPDLGRLPDDTPDTLAAKVLKEEHRIYPLALAEVARKTVS